MNSQCQIWFSRKMLAWSICCQSQLPIARWQIPNPHKTKLFKCRLTNRQSFVKINNKLIFFIRQYIVKFYDINIRKNKIELSYLCFEIGKLSKRKMFKMFMYVCCDRNRTWMINFTRQRSKFVELPQKFNE